MSTRKYTDDFYKNHGPNVGDDPVRFSKIASLCLGHVLDIGCGTGVLSGYHAGPYTGLDISHEAIETAKKHRRESAYFYKADIINAEINLPNNFETIVMAEFLEHLEDEKDLLEKLKEISKENARWIISVPNGDRIPDKDHRREFTVPELRKKFEGYGRVQFHNYPGFDQRIIMTVDLGKKPQRRLGVSMIVKNEEKGLERAILSCIEITDQIAISIDTESKDKTEQIAKRYADIISIHEWNDDFSTPRNEIQQKLATEWVLIIDGHEYVEKCEKLDEALDMDADGLFVKVILENGFRLSSPRLIKQGVGWKYKVHNSPMPKKSRRYSGFTVIHDRDGGQSKESIEDRNKQRDKMVKEIMGEEIKKDRKNPRPYFYIAQQYNYSKNFKNAVKYYKKYIKYSTNTQEKWLAYYNIAVCYGMMNRQSKALWNLWKANEMIANRWEVIQLMGIIYASGGQYTKGLNYLIESFKEDEGDFLYSPIVKNNAITWDTIGKCFIDLKQGKEAKAAFKRALDIHNGPGTEGLNKERAEELEKLLRYIE